MNGSALSWNTRYPVPTQKLPPASITNNTQKGCFGYGPGKLQIKGLFKYLVNVRCANFE